MSIRKKLLSAILICMMCAACTVPKTIRPDLLHVFFFDAGKADAILLYTDESAVLIDAGENGFGTTIRSYLNTVGISSLDAMIITHFDKDHVGGAAEVIANVPVNTIYVSDYPKDSSEFGAFMKAVQGKNIEPVVVSGTEEVSFLLDNVSFAIDGPDTDDYDKDDSNNSSLITSVIYNETSFLLTGDAEEERIEEYLQYHDAVYDVLKIPHHGIWQKALKDLVEVTDPKIAVIPCSKEEGAEQKTMNLLGKNSIRTFLTYEGAVLLVSDGREITVEEY